MTTLATDMESLWHAYHFRILNYVGKHFHLHGQDTVRDLASNVFLRALVAITNGNGPTIDVEGWIFTIARSVCWDYLRAKRRAVFVDWDALANGADDEPTVDDLAEQTIMREQVHGAINRLEGRQGRSMQLRMEGYNNREIAEMTGTTEAAIKQVNVRALSHLREWLQDAA